MHIKIKADSTFFTVSKLTCAVLNVAVIVNFVTDQGDESASMGNEFIMEGGGILFDLN